jgi:glycosyltransferase involved in cell wall biosynthesis
MLARLAPQLKPEFTQLVISLTPLGPVAEQIRQVGIEVEFFDAGTGLNPFTLWQLRKRIMAFKPDIVQTWLYHADLLGGVAARLAGVKAVVWNIRNNEVSKQTTKLRTKLVVHTCAAISRFVPSKILCCAQSAVSTHVRLGYDTRKFTVIANGFDLTRFFPDRSVRQVVRAELGVPETARLIGLIARYDPQKNHAGFLQAAAQIYRTQPDVHFVLAGLGVDVNNISLTTQIKALGLENAVHLLGERRDVARLNQSFDLAVSSSSYGEAFPNVIAEAMACGVPVVATDTGDAALIVGPTGRIVPRHDMTALADACLELLQMSDSGRTTQGTAAQHRIAENFSIDIIVQHYKNFYRKLAVI